MLGLADDAEGMRLRFGSITLRIGFYERRPRLGFARVARSFAALAVKKTRVNRAPE